jgi:hypothetical protein
MIPGLALLCSKTLSPTPLKKKKGNRDIARKEGDSLKYYLSLDPANPEIRSTYKHFDYMN